MEKVVSEISSVIITDQTMGWFLCNGNTGLKW